MARSYVKSYKRKPRSSIQKAASRQRAAKMAAVRQVANLRTGGFIGMELKFYDLYHAATLASSATMAGLEQDPGTELCLNGMASDTDPSTRDGRQITMKNIYISGHIYDNGGPAAGTVQTQIVYIALVLDTQTNRAQLNSEDVFVNPGGATSCIAPLRNLEYSKRFRVLDHVRLEVPVDLVWQGTTTEHCYRRVPFKLAAKLDKVVNFVDPSTAASGVSAITDNSLHIIACATDNAVVGISYNSRLRFVG